MEGRRKRKGVSYKTVSAHIRGKGFTKLICNYFPHLRETRAYIIKIPTVENFTPFPHTYRSKLITNDEQKFLCVPGITSTEQEYSKMSRVTIFFYSPVHVSSARYCYEQPIRQDPKRRINVVTLTTNGDDDNDNDDDNNDNNNNNNDISTMNNNNRIAATLYSLGT